MVTTFAPITLPYLLKMVLRSLALVMEDRPETHKLRDTFDVVEDDEADAADPVPVPLVAAVAAALFTVVLLPLLTSSCFTLFTIDAEGLLLFAAAMLSLVLLPLVLLIAEESAEDIFSVNFHTNNRSRKREQKYIYIHSVK